MSAAPGLPRRRGRAGARGFTLLELIFAVGIVAVALLGLQAAVSGAILSAGDSVNQRAAREYARIKLEEILAGAEQADGSGTIEDHPELTWTSRSEELMVGMPEHQTMSVRVVVFELSYPTGAGGGPASAQPGAGGFGTPGRETIQLASVLPPEAE